MAGAIDTESRLVPGRKYSLVVPGQEPVRAEYVGKGHRFSWEPERHIFIWGGATRGGTTFAKERSFTQKGLVVDRNRVRIGPGCISSALTIYNASKEQLREIILTQLSRKAENERSRRSA